MADLLTHYISARIPGGFVADERARATLVMGVFLPDLVGKTLEWIPNAPRHLAHPSHTLLGVTCLAFATAMLFSQEFRLKAFITLLCGELIHIAVDLGKDSDGYGSSFLFHPFSLKGYVAGWYTTQDVFWFLPGNLVLLWLMRLVAKKAKERGWVWK